MTFTIDHVVIGVYDLEQAVTDYRAAGFNVIPGGRHADGLTHNALIVFQDGTYLELLAPTSQALLKNSDMLEKGFLKLLRHGEGLATFALQSDDLAADMERLETHGLATRMMPAAGRVRPDGIELQWRTAWLVDEMQPFFIQDITPRKLRVPDQEEVCTHPNSALGTAGVRVSIAHLGAAEKYKWISGQDAAVGKRFDIRGVGIEVVVEPELGQTERLSEVVLKGQRSAALPKERMHQAAIRIQATP